MAIVGCAAGDLMSDVLLCNVGAVWRMTVKELTHTMTERCASGKKTSLDVLVHYIVLMYINNCLLIID